MTDGTVKRIAEKYSVFQSDVARFESAIREALQEYAASEWVDVRTRAITVCDMLDAILEGKPIDEGWLALLRGNVNGLRAAIKGEIR